MLETFRPHSEFVPMSDLSKQPVIVSHGDAHNANVWIRRESSGRPTLILFDPAFAGNSIPALVGEIKATFHNIFAHPLWLYTPDLAARAFRVCAECNGDGIVISHDWELSKLRQEFLRLKIEKYWRPLLHQLRTLNALPYNWEEIMRSALFCCPTLVMNLLSGPLRTESISLLAFSIAVMCGSTPKTSSNDPVAVFFAELRTSIP